MGICFEVKPLRLRSHSLLITTIIWFLQTFTCLPLLSYSYIHKYLLYILEKNCNLPRIMLCNIDDVVIYNFIDTPPLQEGGGPPLPLKLPIPYARKFFSRRLIRLIQITLFVWGKIFLGMFAGTAEGRPPNMDLLQ